MIEPRHSPERVQLALKRVITIDVAYVTLLAVLLITGMSPRHLVMLVIYMFFLTITTFVYYRSNGATKQNLWRSSLRTSAFVILILLVPILLLSASKSAQVSTYATAVYAFIVGASAVFASDHLG